MKKIFTLVLITTAIATQAQQVAPSAQSGINPEYIRIAGKLQQEAITKKSISLGLYAFAGAALFIGNSNYESGAPGQQTYKVAYGVAGVVAAIGLSQQIMYYVKLSRSGAYLEASVTGVKLKF